MDPDFTIVTDTGTWVELLLQTATVPGALQSGALQLEGTSAQLFALLSLFAP